MRLIDAYKIDIDRDSYDTYADYIKAFDTINEAPTVDALVITRCKDCRHFMNADENYMDEYGNYQTTCQYMGEASEEDFCSKVERK